MTGEAIVRRQGAINRPIAGEVVCGDAWSSHLQPGRNLYLMADGLGHWPAANEAAEEAVRVFQSQRTETPKQILEVIHRALAKTRGAAVAIAEIVPERSVLNFVGSGNIAASIYANGEAHYLVSMNGTPGHTMSTLQQFAYDWKPGSMLLMHSDGISSRWKLDNYPGLVSRHPTLIAGVLFRDFARRRDDATILVTGI